MKICESETIFLNFVNLPKVEKVPLKYFIAQSVTECMQQIKSIYEHTYSLLSCRRHAVTLNIYGKQIILTSCPAVFCHLVES